MYDSLVCMYVCDVCVYSLLSGVSFTGELALGMYAMYEHKYMCENFIHVYTNMCLCDILCVYPCVLYIYIYIHIFIFIYIYIYMHIYIYIYKYIKCLCDALYVYSYVYVYIYIYNNMMCL